MDNELENLNSFCRHDAINIEGNSAGTLAGLTFAAKDLYEVEGYHCCAGNPTWLETHGPCSETAPVITSLLREGASLVGKTICDELAFSLVGENIHYGTPLNPGAPDRVPGGSSSGSASVAAAGLVDFSLGTDTAGSVRVPASYCGVFGMRPTHGIISTDGIIALAPTFDTVGWFSRSAKVMGDVGRILLPAKRVEPSAIKVAYPSDIFEGLLPERSRAATEAPLDLIKQCFGDFVEVRVGLSRLDVWREAFRVMQGFDIWRVHGEWISERSPKFGPGIKERFEWTSTVSQEQLEGALPAQNDASEWLKALIPENGVLCIPTAPGAAPLLKSPPEEVDKYRTQTLALSCMASIARMPQITMPIGRVDNAPFGISFLAHQQNDLLLLSAAEQIEAVIDRTG